MEMAQPSIPAIAQAISQNSDAVDQIKTASDDLGVVHAVLSTHIAEPPENPDVLTAVERTDEIGQQLAETAEALERTTELLRQAQEGATKPASAG